MTCTQGYHPKTKSRRFTYQNRPVLPFGSAYITKSVLPWPILKNVMLINTFSREAKEKQEADDTATSSCEALLRITREIHINRAYKTQIEGGTSQGGCSPMPQNSHQANKIFIRWINSIHTLFPIEFRVSVFLDFPVRVLCEQSKYHSWIEWLWNRLVLSVDGKKTTSLSQVEKSFLLRKPFENALLL